MKRLPRLPGILLILVLLGNIFNQKGGTSAEELENREAANQNFVYLPLVLNNYQPPPPAPLPGFAIGSTPFRFVGGFVPGWHWGQEWWNQATDTDLIRTAREHGLTVLDIMLPQFEKQLGVYDESELAKLDSFLNTASTHNMYVMIEFIHGLDIGTQPDNPYYHPHGIEGLITDPQLAQAFNHRIEALVNRRNTLNQRIYRDDPTILGWILVNEPISAPWNYPGGAPNVTAAQLNTWLTTVGTFVKSLDPNHLVTVAATPAIDTLGQNWLSAFDVPQLDFIYAEDADLRILNYLDPNAAADFPLKLFLLNKPVVMMLSFTSGAWDRESICHDYEWQADVLGKAIHRYFEAGETGVTVFMWGSDLYPSVPAFDECFNYTASNLPVSQALQQAAGWINPMSDPNPPLQFVSIRR